MSSFIYKPYGQGQVGTGKATFVLQNPGISSGGIYDQSGKLIENLTRWQGAPEGGASPGVKFYAGNGGGSYADGFTAKFKDSAGKEYSYNIANGANRYVGDYQDPNSIQIDQSNPTGGGGFGGGATGVPPGFTPGNFGGFGFFPAYLGNSFPSPATIKYNPITGAQLQYTDPIKYAKENAGAIKDLYNQNLDLAQTSALKELDTELKGLEQFTPAALALKQGATSAENVFNQGLRTAQVDSTLPGARPALTQQLDDARTYAAGGVPQGINDHALELGVRSQAADQASVGGFGQAGAARKVSDLLSAQQRIGLSQYGNSLIQSNLAEQANLFLAPTEYSQGASTIPVVPSLSGSQLASSNLAQLNELTQIPATTGLASSTQQKEFQTSLDQGTQEFNASNKLGTAEFNANNKNNFALQKFGYDASYAGAVAGAGQTAANTGIAIQQQQQAQQIVSDFINKAQSAQQFGAIASLLGSLVGGAGGVSGLISSIGGLFKGGNGATSTQPPTGGSGSATGSSPSPSPTPQAPGIDGSGVSVGSAGGLPSTGVSSDINGADAPPSVPPFDVNAGTPPPSVDTPSTGVSGDINVPDTPVSVPPFNVGDTGGGIDLGSTVSDFGSDLNLESARLNAPVTKALLSASAPVLRNAGVYNEPVQGSAHAGYNTAGRPIYLNTRLGTSTNLGAGQQYGAAMSQMIQPLGATTPEDHALIDKVSANSSDPKVVGDLDAAYSNRDPKAFVNAALSATNQGTFDPNKNLSPSFTAYQMYQNWDKMSPAQKSMALSSLGIKNLKSSDGSYLGDKPLIKDADGKTKLTLSGGLNLMAQGINTYGLVKHWPELKVAEAVAQGTGDVGQVAKFAKDQGLLGSGTSNAAVPQVSKESLAQGGWKAVPQYGIGAVAGTAASQLPHGYAIVSNGPKGVIAVPQANAKSYSGAGTSGTGALSVYNNWGRGGALGAYGGAVGGSQVAAGLSNMGIGNNYVLGGVVAASMLGGVLGAKLPQSKLVNAGVGAFNSYENRGGNNGYKAAADDIVQGVNNIDKVSKGQRATYGQQQVALAVADRYTGGAAGKLASYGRTQWPGLLGPEGSISKLDAKTNPFSIGINALFGGGKETEHANRDTIRQGFQGNGLLSKDGSITLADGSMADINSDGRDASHSVRFADKLVKGQENRSGTNKLSSYDVDYTNDMDYASSMGGIALSRLVSGGTSKSIDQIGGQFGNGALGKVGYGKDMSADNFNSVMGNLRGMYAKAGISSKTEAYQLINQGLAEHRWSDSDAVSMQQAANMIYDKDGFGTAQKLMAGRFRGVEVAASQGKDTTSPVTPTAHQDFIGGRPQQLGAATNTNFTPKLTDAGVNLRNLTKDEIRKINQSRYRTVA